MDLNELTNILRASLNPTTQKASEEALKRAEQANFPEYLRALATIICDNSRPPEVIRTAGVLLKNYFYDTRSEAGLRRKYHAWNTLVPEPIRQYIREYVLRGLLMPVVESRQSAAQIVAALGVLEIGEGRWPEMISTLYNTATSKEVPDDIKVHTLEAMGFLCESLSPTLVTEAITNNLLTAIVENMKPIKNPMIRLSAIKALYNTLNFAEANMKRDAERDYIVSQICECARADHPDVRSAAFDCMCQLAEFYYNLLSVPYMDAFFQLTVMNVKAAGALGVGTKNFQTAEQVALHALNFWSTLAERELDLDEDDHHARSSGNEVDPAHICQHYIQKAMRSLVELITTFCLTKQGELLTDDEDNWTLAMSGGTLLGLIARCDPDNILSAIMPFVQKNLPLMGEENWRQREAGLVAFGMCLDGPGSDELAPRICEGLDYFLSLLNPAKEVVPQVRHSATWVIGRVCDLHVDTIIEFLHRVVQALLSVLSDPIPLVAAQSAEAIGYLAQSFRQDNTELTNKLSPFLAQVLPRLMETSERPDWDEGELRGVCFEAMNHVVQSCANDGFPIIDSLLQAVIGKLDFAVKAQPQVTTQSQREEVQGMIQYCCGTILVIAQRLRAAIMPKADMVMILVVRILESVHAGAVLMDAHLVVGAIATALGPGFAKYYKTVLPFIVRGLENNEDYQTCQTATELVSDMARSVNQNLAEDTPTLVGLMLKNLANEDLHRSVKPTTISALADIALALGQKFEFFADKVLATLDAASMLDVPRDDPDMVDYLNEIRDAVCEAYTAIINALRPSQISRKYFHPNRIEGMLNFVLVVCREGSFPDSDVSESVVKGAVGLLGDICTLSQEYQYKVRTAFAAFKPAIDICLLSDDDDAKQTGEFCMKAISK